MFTNEQVRGAMQGLVDKMGGDHTGEARYGNGKGGECFLGALCEYMGRAIPIEGTRAADVLGVGAVSPEMQTAFAVAQYLNDAHFEWKYVLIGVDKSLAHGVHMAVGSCPCGCSLNSEVFTRIVDEIKALRALNKSKQAQASIQKVVDEFTSLSAALNKVSTTSFATGGFMSSYTNSTLATSAALAASKKDHALVA